MSTGKNALEHVFLQVLIPRDIFFTGDVFVRNFHQGCFLTTDG
jgi:hypothetical protein